MIFYLQTTLIEKFIKNNLFTTKFNKIKYFYPAALIRPPVDVSNPYSLSDQ